VKVRFLTLTNAEHMTNAIQGLADEGWRVEHMSTAAVVTRKSDYSAYFETQHHITVMMVKEDDEV